MIRLSLKDDRQLSWYIKTANDYFRYIRFTLNKCGITHVNYVDFIKHLNISTRLFNNIRVIYSNKINYLYINNEILSYLKRFLYHLNECISLFSSFMNANDYNEECVYSYLLSLKDILTYIFNVISNSV